MATENIVTGKKYRILKDAANKIWDVISFWTKASDVYNNNNQNLQTTVGGITGISSSLTSTSSSIAASANAVKQLNDKITKLNSDLATSFKFQISAAPNHNYYQLAINNLVDVSKYSKMTVSGIKKPSQSTVTLCGWDSGANGFFPNTGTAQQHILPLNTVINISSWNQALLMLLGNANFTETVQTIYEVEFMV